VDPIALLAFLSIGALAGLLAGLLGIGGGVVIVPALLWLFSHLSLAGMDPQASLIPQQAVATSLATVMATGLASALAHHRRGAVELRLLVQLLPGLLLGAWLGALAAAHLPAAWLTRLFALFLFYSGARMVAQPSVQAHASLPGTPGLAAAGTGFGALSALLGIGGGILVVPYLAGRGVRMAHAVATASACGVPLALAGSIAYMLSGWGRAGLPPHSLGFVYWPAALAIMAASVPLAPLGARLAHWLPTAVLKRLFGALLLLIALRLALL